MRVSEYPGPPRITLGAHLFLRAYVVTLACAVVMAGCTSGRTPAGGPTRPTLRVGVAQPVGVSSTSAALEQVAGLLRYAALVNAATDGSMQPGLAARWDTSPDGRLWRFHLRPQLVFDDGTPLDATAAVSSLENARRGPRITPGLRDIVRIAAESATDLIIEQRSYSSLLLEALSQAWITGQNGEAAAGPYRLVSRETARIVVEASPGYFRGRPRIERIELLGYPSPRAAWVAFMRGDVDFLYDVPPEAGEFIVGSSSVRTFSFLRPYVHLLGFNLAHPVLRDVRARRGLAMAVDRSAVVTQAFAGRGRPASAPLWPRHFASMADASPMRRDAVRARELLGEAVGRDVLSGPPIRISCLMPEGYPAFERSLLALQRQLLDVGVDLQAEVVPLPQMIARLAAGRFDAYLFEQATGLGVNWAYWFWHSPEDGSPWIKSGYTAADDVLERIRAASDPEEFRRATREFQQRMLDDPPAVFLAWRDTSRAVRGRFEVPSEADRDVFVSIPQWLPAGEGGAR